MPNEPVTSDFLEVNDEDLRSLSPSGIFQMATAMSSRGRRARAVESRLALAVQELTGLEEGTEASLRAASKVLEDGRRRHLHEESGFDSWNELRHRLIGSRTLLEALLGIDDPEELPPPPASGILPTGRDDSRKRRGQRGRALVRLSGSILKMRNIEEDLRRRTAASRAVLEHIESSRLHEECGYTSFEEFLACVLAPCPTLAISMATAEEGKSDPSFQHPAANDVECAAERLTRRRATPPPLPPSSGALLAASAGVPAAPSVRGVEVQPLPTAAVTPSMRSLPMNGAEAEAPFAWPRVPLPFVFAAGIAIALLLAWPPDLTIFGP